MSNGEPNFSVNFTARVLGTLGAVAQGDALVFDPNYTYQNKTGFWLRATAAQRASTGVGADAIALTAYGGSSISKVAYQASGVLPQEISGLTALTPGSANKLVRVSSAGRLERIDSYTAGDDVVGYARWNGRVCLHIGLPWDIIAALAGGSGGGASPAGVDGDIQVKSGSAFNVVGYWKANGNAGKLRATYWDPVDGVTVRSVLEVSAGAVTGASEVLPTTGFIRISDSVGNAFPLIMRSRSGVDQIIISSSGGAVQFGDDSAVTTTDLKGWQVNLTSGSGAMFLTAGGIGITANSQFNAFDARLWVLRGLDSGVLNTSGFSLGSTTIATSGGTTTLTSAQAASLCLVFTGTGGTVHAADRTRNVYFADATGCSGAVTIDDGTATGVTVAAGKFDIIIHDGTNYRSALTNASAGGITALANVGTGTGLVWRDTTSGTANLKSIKAGTGIAITNNANDVTAAMSLPGTANQVITTDGSGNPTAVGTTITSSAVTTGVSKTTQTGVTSIDVIAEVAQQQTTTATQTTVYTASIPNNATTTFDFRVTACKSDSSAGDVWRGRITFRNVGGTVTVISAANVTKDGSTSWAVTADNSGATMRILITGQASTTIVWGASVNYQVNRQS